jgi:hypothetical protein
MRTSNKPARKFLSTVGKITMALVFISMIGGTFIAPAFGRDHDRRGGRYYDHGRRGYYQSQPYYYNEPVYAPPPVVYAPMPSPGINLIFPFRIR